MTQQLRTFQSNLTGGILSPSMWSRPDVSKYQTGVKELTNFLIRPQGGVRARAGNFFIGAILDEDVRNAQQGFEVGAGESYILDFGHETLRFIRDDAYILDSTNVNAISAVDDGSPAVFTSVAHGLTDGDYIRLDGTGDVDLDGADYLVDNADTDTFTLLDRWGNAVDRTGKDALTAGEAVAHYIVATPYDAAHIDKLVIAQDQNVGYITHREYPVQRLERVAPDNWTLAAETFTPTTTAPTGVTATADTGSGAVTYRYKVSAVAEANGEESLPSDAATVTNDLGIAGSKNEITWSAVAGATRYIVYKEDNGVYGYIGGTDGLAFMDENITADLSDGPQQPRNPFNGAGDYPGVGTFFEQRLWLASTINNPAGVWASQSVNPRNFQVSSPLKASDAITFRVRANRVVQIEALVPAAQLILLTRGSEWVVRGGDNAEYLTPTNIVLRRRAYRGSADVQPVLAGDFIVHVQRGGDAIRDFGLDRDVTSTDMTLLAKHLFRGKRVRSLAYQQKPDSIIWVVTDTGELKALTYMLEHDIWGWSEIEIGGGGYVEGVAVVEQGDDDVVYLQVRRIVNNVACRYIERLDTVEAKTSAEVHHLDSGLRWEFDMPVEEVIGCWHLEGETVAALLDGSVYYGLTVQDGRITLPVDASTISIGYPYTARLRTLDLDVGSVRGLGSMLGRFKSVTEIRLRVEDTRGIYAAHDNADVAYTYKQRAEELWSTAIELFTGDVVITPEADWTTGGEVVLEQRDPLPACINGLLLDWEFGE